MRWLSLLALLAGLQAARAIDLFGRTRDPFGHFCGKADCYEVLGVAREAEKEEIRKAYRGLSREHHPDKGGDKVKFAVIAKAYEVLNNDEKREEYNFILDHPDAYTEKYGMHVVFEYAPTTDVRLVLLLIIAVWSAFVWAVQKSKHARAVRFIIAAAEADLRQNKGGTVATMAVRRYAELVVSKREAQLDDSPTLTGTKGGKQAGKSKGKKTRGREGKEEHERAVQEVIGEVARKAKLVGEYCEPGMQHVPVIWLLKLPYTVSVWMLYLARWCVMRSALPQQDVLYWTIRKVGMDTWSGLDEDERETALSREIWKADYESVMAWRENVGLLGNDVIRIAKPTPSDDIDWQLCFGATKKSK